MLRNLIIISGVVLCLIGCKKSDPEPFSFTLKGTVIGFNEGKLRFSMSPRVGDEVYAEIKNGEFYYEGEAQSLTQSFFEIVELQRGGLGIIILEPGEIEIELTVDSTKIDTRVIQGVNNREYHELIDVYSSYRPYLNIPPDADNEAVRLKKVYVDSLAGYLEENLDRLSNLLYIEGFGPFIFSNERIGSMLEKIKKTKLGDSKYYKRAYSKYLSVRDSVHSVGTQAKDFALPDSTGKKIRFSKYNPGNLTFVDWSGSWCGNSTRASLELLPIYEKYHPMGFDIITVVGEYRYDRWIKWLRKYNFPWTVVIELDDNNTNELMYMNYLFPDDKRYLVDENNTVIANDLNSGRLNEILMKHYEPEEYATYIKNKWNFPEGISFLDKENPINTVDELFTMFKGKTVLLDFWATWCQPCIAEFKYYDELWPFLKENDIELVYIAQDGYREETQWLQYIRKHNLKGQHVRSSNELALSFYNKGYGINKYPTYMIIDPEGNITNADAARPSELEELKGQLLGENK